MSLNKKKCGILFLTNKKFKKRKSLYQIPIVKSYKYLGLEINKDLNLNLHTT